MIEVGSGDRERESKVDPKISLLRGIALSHAFRLPEHSLYPQLIIHLHLTSFFLIPFSCSGQGQVIKNIIRPFVLRQSTKFGCNVSYRSQLASAAGLLLQTIIFYFLVSFPNHSVHSRKE